MRGWHLHTRTDLTFQELARRVNPKVAGWINYYGRFRPWELIPLWRASTPTCCAGSARSTNGSRPSGRRLRSCRRSLGDTPACSRTGASLRPRVPCWSDDQDDKSRVTGDC
ncbi:group II intron maturase-specific domain-containing protein [Streptomyces sanglieri]|uniref:Group II intron maturase-specific domain-containing protein n=1 Tax=Streptomyces sanglieri TaxID=193460 RepID=A0ABW2X723_9ACTN